MTIGSPRRFISARRGSVIGRREASAGTWKLRAEDIAGWSSLGVQDRVVDEACGSDAGGDRDEHGAVDARDGEKVVGADEGEVLGLDAEARHRGAARGGDRGRVALASLDRFGRGFERLGQRERALVVGPLEVDVAARQGHAVGLAHRPDDSDARGDVEVADEAAYDGGLLGVLLAEVRGVGLRHVEELAYDGRDALEVACAPVIALQVLGEARHPDRRREAGRVHLRDRRGEEEVGAGGLRLAGVARLVEGVGVEGRGLVELRRVDEERDNDDVVLVARRADEAEVAVVQRAHGGDEADAAAGAARAVERGAQVRDRADGPHAGTTLARSRVAAASESNRGRRSGARSAIAARWRSTTASSPRTIGPVSAARAPSAAQFSTAARTSGTSASRGTPAVAATRSAAPSIVVRKFAAMAAAAWYAGRSSSAIANGRMPSAPASVRAASSARS